MFPHRILAGLLLRLAEMLARVLGTHVPSTQCPRPATVRFVLALLDMLGELQEFDFAIVRRAAAATGWAAKHWAPAVAAWDDERAQYEAALVSAYIYNIMPHHPGAHPP